MSELERQRKRARERETKRERARERTSDMGEVSREDVFHFYDSKARGAWRNTSSEMVSPARCVTTTGVCRTSMYIYKYV